MFMKLTKGQTSKLEHVPKNYFLVFKFCILVSLFSFRLRFLLFFVKETANVMIKKFPELCKIVSSWELSSMPSVRQEFFLHAIK